MIIDGFQLYFWEQIINKTLLENIMRSGIKVFSVLLTLSGIIWALQGAGIFPYPASSIMINQPQWITYGVITAVVGVVIWLVAKQKGKANPPSEE